MSQVLPSRELGLALGLIVGRHFFGMEDLHYGFWPDGLAPTPANLPQAQRHYTDFLLQQIPDGVRSILDVGCGAGNTAARLVQLGYDVDCLSPNTTLNRIVRERLGDQVGLHECRFEDFRATRRYDLILFSESLLFIRLEPGLTRARELLVPGGHVLISDLFRTTTERGPIGGGHDLAVFRKTLDELSWRALQDHDVTARIAPTFDVLSEAAVALRPAYDLIRAQIEGKFAFWFRLLYRGKLRAKVERYERKHFGGERNGASFRRYKEYRVLLLEETRS